MSLVKCASVLRLINSLSKTDFYLSCPAANEFLFSIERYMFMMCTHATDCTILSMRFQTIILLSISYTAYYNIAW